MPKFGDRPCQQRFAHESAAPEAIEEQILRDDLAAMFGKEQEQVDEQGANVYLFRSSREAAGIALDQPAADAQPVGKASALAGFHSARI